MNLFGFLSDFFKRKKKDELPEEALKWNKMWDLWADEKAASPYAEIMTYESEVNNGGHMQFFDNVSSTSDLTKTLSELYSVLDDVLKTNLENAYNAFLNEETDEEIDEIIDRCDSIFYENEEKIEKLLKEYAKTMILD